MLVQREQFLYREKNVLDKEWRGLDKEEEAAYLAGSVFDSKGKWSCT